MDLSIVIVSYNTKELLANCLKSISAASKSLSSETFVVDNNSKDSTASDIPKNFSWVNFIQNKKNLGFSKANNIAIKKAKGKYILILNPDTELLPETLVKTKAFMDHASKDIAVATCRVELLSGKLDRDCRRHFPTPWTAFSHFSGLAKLFPKSKIFNSYYMGYKDENTEHEIDSCEGAFMFIRSAVLEKVGIFDEDFFFYGEDLDLCFRIKEAGYKIIYTPIVKIIHLKGGASGIKKHSAHVAKVTKESKLNALRESTRAMKLFYKKHYERIYPFFINWLMYTGIWIVEKLRLSRA